MTTADWLIVAFVLGAMVWSVLASRRYSHGVADFLAAGRSAGRYVLTVSQGAGELGAITIIGLLEMNYVAGFSQTWWGMTMGVVILFVSVSGWVIYRFRQTRCLTLAEFFERRYSRRFRIFAGMLAFVAGIINFGIFPAVGARFFIYFCGIPESVGLAGLDLPTYPLTMIALLGISLFFVFSGGQVAVIIADFVQGIFFNVVFVLIAIYLALTLDWNQIYLALATAPDNASLVDPFKTSHVEDFNLWYFLIGIFGVIYGKMSWQGTQGYNACARSAHEAKMAGVLANWRWIPRDLLLLFVPIVIFTVMHHVDFSAEAAGVNEALATIDSEAVRNQLRVPLGLRALLPVGLVGAFAAVMLACFISTHDTYLHSWGSIFIQDVVMPFRKKPLEPKQHLRLLRWSILGVALFIFLFSLLFRQSEYILLFFAITGAIFAGGSGAVIIGGLYWKRGTTAAAWTSMTVGAGIAVSGIVIHQLVDDFFINGQFFWALAMGGALVSYVLVSLLGRQPPFDLDSLLHRGAETVEAETRIAAPVPARGWRLLGVGREFTGGDRAIYVAAYAWIFSWFAVFVAGTIYNLGHPVPAPSWFRFWRIYLTIQIAAGLVVIVWFAIGGIRDMLAMLRTLAARERDPRDDGRVHQERT